MPLAPGASLLHYTIVESLGAGAMGEVWRARDTRLGREVAIKVLPEHFADDEERLRRFEREARALAALSHPNVAQIHGVDQVDDTCFLVLELVAGESLEERLRRGPLPVDEALDVGRQIAEGLEAAHEAGVIHRDLKPANVHLGPDGRVKLLDFGLAKPASASSGARSTDSVLSTEVGRLLGTPTYMAPEQARGKLIDKRVDIWAFGCVLYECLTGKRAFDGETLSDVLGAVMRDEPDVARLPHATPARVRELVERCLRKDPRQRLRDIGEARLVLEHPGAPGVAPRVERGSRLAWTVAGVALASLVLMLARGTFGAAAPVDAGPPPRLSVRLPHGVSLLADQNLAQNQVLALSPDGSCLAFVAQSDGRPRLYLRRLAALEVVPLAGTEDATSPFFSADGRWIGFFAGGKLKKVATSGGAPIELCDVGLNRGGAFGPDGSIVFAPTTTSGLFRLPPEGGPPVELTHLDPGHDERSHRWPAFLAGGEEVAFTVGTRDKPGDYDDATIDRVSLATGERRRLTSGASMVRVAASGDLVLGRLDQLLLLPHAAGSGSIAGAQPVLQGVAGEPSSGVVYFDLARDGTLAYMERNPQAGQYQLAWVSREGVVEPLPFPLREYRVPRLSPDGKQIAVAIGPGRGRASDIWIADIEDGSLTRLSSGGKDVWPLWSRDGKRVTYLDLSPHDTLMSKTIGGGEPAKSEAVFADARDRTPLAWSPDEHWLLFEQDGGPGRSSDLMAWSVEEARAEPIVATESVEYAGALSPDGRWFAYSSDASGRIEVYVQAFPGPGGHWQVSEGGSLPRWAPDGSELCFVDGNRMMVVSVRVEPSISFGAPRVVFELPYSTGDENVANYDVAPDGRFLVVRDTAEESMTEHVNVILGFDAELRRALTDR